MNNLKAMEIPFSPPDVTEAELNEIADALRSGWITTGPKVKKLEALLSQYVGTEKCVCLNSQTACGEMSLRLLGIGPGDEVITSAYTYTASASVIDHVGAKIVLVDTQKDSLEMDYDAMEDAINERTKAVIPVDLGGVPCDYDRIFAAVERKRGLFRPSENALQRALGRVAVIADAAHALGAVRDGRMVGTIADFSNFSFHAVKNFTTAEGGMITWRKLDGVDSEELYRRLELMSLHGQSKDALSKAVGGWEYDILGLWYKCNMTDIAAAMGIAQFARYPAMLRRRRELIERYDEALHPLGLRTVPHYTEKYASSGHLYLTFVPGIGEKERGEIIRVMGERGVSCNVHYKPLPMFSAYRELGFDITAYPNAYGHYVNEITLPLHTRLTDEEAQYVIDCYRDVLRCI